MLTHNGQGINANIDGTGVFFNPNGNQNILDVNLDPKDWGATFGAGGTKKIVGVKDFANAVFANAASKLPADTTATILRQGYINDIADTATDIVIGLGNGGELDASDAPKQIDGTKPGGAIVVGDNGYDTIYGSSGADLIMLGSGYNTVEISWGGDWIISGGGPTTLTADDTSFNGAAALPNGGSAYYVSGGAKDKVDFGVGVRDKFKLSLLQKSPIGDSKSWAHYTATENNKTYDLWIDPVDNYTVYLPESASSNTSRATDEYGDANAPQIDVTQTENFVTATASGDWSLDKKVGASTIDIGALR